MIFKTLMFLEIVINKAERKLNFIRTVIINGINEFEKLVEDPIK